MKFQKKIFFLLYISLFRHTPEDYRPYSLFFPFIRSYLVRKSILKCGKNLRVKSNADISPKISIGEFSELGTRCKIQSNVEIGNHVIMGPDVKIYSRNHIYDDPNLPIQLQGKSHGEVVIGNNVWIGANVTILPEVKVGDNVIIAAGAIITKSIPGNKIVGGNPARIIKELYANDNKS